MPHLPPHPCPHPGCPRLVPAGTARCPEHTRADAPPAWRTTTGSATARGYGAAWQRLRRSILRRDPVCMACQRRPATTVDHVTPKARGGTDDPANLQGLCRACHARKSARDGHASRARKNRSG